MRGAALAAAFVLAACGAAAQEKQPRKEPPGKGDAIVVKGCLSGTALEATDLGSLDATGGLANGLVFRLTGNKALLKQMRDEHDGRIVEVSGRLKSDLPRESVATRKLGKMKITIGSPATGAPSAASEARRSVPVLEVASFDGSTTHCGR